MEPPVPEAHASMLLPVARALRAGKGKVMVGAGLSVPAGLPSWLDLVKPMLADGLGVDVTWSDDLTELTQYFCDTVPGGRARLLDAIAQGVLPSAQPTLVHELLSELPIAECWTTNFDRLLEQALPSHAVVLTEGDLVRVSTRPDPILVKMHGSISHKELTDAERDEIVLTRDDFEHYQERRPRTWSRLASGYLGGGMLFLGLSLSDPNMKLLARPARTANRTGIDATGVVILRTPTDPQELARFKPRVSDLGRSGVQVLEVADFSEIPKLLRHLVERLRPPRVVVSGSTNSLDRKGAERALEAASLLGEQLAQRGLALAFGGSDVGATVAQRLASTAELRHRYDPTLVTAVRRRIITEADYIGYPPGPGRVGMPRDGTIRFQGESAREMRAYLATQGCVVVVIGGGAGTASELQQFADAGLMILPWSATGGTAADEAWRLEEFPHWSRFARADKLQGALMSPDLRAGAIALAEILEGVVAPYADTGPMAAV